MRATRSYTTQRDAIEILPLESMLVRFLARNWHDKSELPDLLQETYLRVYEAARRDCPLLPKPFLFQVARNLIIDRLRKNKVLTMDTVGDFESLEMYSEEPTPEQHVAGRQQVRLVQAALDDLPKRCREIFMLRKVDCLSQREVSKRLGVGEDMVERHLANALRLLNAAICSRRAEVFAESRRYFAKQESKAR